MEVTWTAEKIGTKKPLALTATVEIVALIGSYQNIITTWQLEKSLKTEFMVLVHN